jgi:hypothetical protein
MTITPDQERALLALYEAVKLCDETYEWIRDEDPTSYSRRTSLALLMWSAMDTAYAAFGYEPNTNRAIVSLEYIDTVMEEEEEEEEAKRAAREQEAKP